MVVSSHSNSVDTGVDYNAVLTKLDCNYFIDIKTEYCYSSPIRYQYISSFVKNSLRLKKALGGREVSLVYFYRCGVFDETSESDGGSDGVNVQTDCEGGRRPQKRD